MANSGNTKYDEMIAVMDSVYRHKLERGAEGSDTLFYKLLTLYHSRVRHAPGEGKPVVAHTVLVPPELFYAMDIIPVQIENAINTTVTSLKNQEEVFSIAKSFGMAPELCSAHRAQAAFFLQGWLPHLDGMVYSHQVCDSSVKSGEVFKDIYGLPCYFLDRPYGYSEKEVQYYAQELGDAAAFLESLTGHRFNPQRLQAALNNTWQMMELQQEVDKLRELVPSPMAGRRGSQCMVIAWLFSGSTEAVEYFTVVRDELRERVAQGRGIVPQEKHRLICVFPPPPIAWKMMDWMEREHGAVVVADPFDFHWGEWEVDPSHLLESLARKCFACPVSRQLHGPAAAGALPDTVADAISHRAQGALFWANIGCRHGCALIRSIKDALRDQVGIPTVVLDTDMLDPSISPEQEVKDKLEGFFEVLSQS